jgi:hypothetical protein
MTENIQEIDTMAAALKAEADRANVRLVSSNDFKRKSMNDYRDVLTFCFNNPDQAVEWPKNSVIEDKAEAVRLQNGFHSSGMGRLIRDTHTMLTAVVQRGNGWKIQIRVSEKTDDEREAEKLRKELAARRRLARKRE